MNRYDLAIRRQRHSLTTAALWGAAVALLNGGCKTPSPVTTPAITAAACVLVDRLPESAGYLRAAAEVFRLAGATHPPAPADIRAALAALPNARLTAAQQTALWAATTAAYSLAYSRARTPADLDDLRANLTGIAVALVAAVDTCAPPGPATSGRGDALPRPPALDEQGLYDLSRTIAKTL